MELQTINAIIKTLCYSEVFSYPLTFSELSKYLISREKISDREILFTLSKYRDLFEEERGFIVLKNSRRCIKERIQHMVESRKKLAKALWIAGILAYIPTIKLIGISGSLSMYNAKKEDDIDLFFITSKDTLWISRFFVLFALFILGQKRAVSSKFVKDKICPNMFIAEDALSIEKKRRNLYTAHEIIQLKVLHSKDYMKERFLHKNKWVLRYMPNAFKPSKSTHIVKRGSKILNYIDSLLFVAQKLYMRKRVTNETVEKKRAFFHPTKIDKTIERIYELKVYHRSKQLVRVSSFPSPHIRIN